MSGRTFADLGIVTRANHVIEQPLPCPRCDRGPRDDALAANVETGALTASAAAGRTVLTSARPERRHHCTDLTILSALGACRSASRASGSRRMRATRPGLRVSFILPDHGGDLNDELLHLSAN